MDQLRRLIFKWARRLLLGAEQKASDLHPLLARIPGLELIMVDVGARGGMSGYLQNVQPFTRAVGFEPAAESFPTPTGSPFREERYLPYALAAQSGDIALNISRRPGATSTLMPDAQVLDHFAADAWAEMKDIVGVERVPARTLSDVFNELELPGIDLIKLDTQGNELDILRSAGPHLKQIGVIKVEVEMLPLYQGQPLLGDVFNYLIEQGFELIDLPSTPPCRRYHYSDQLPFYAYRLVWADAIFAYRPTDFSGPRKLQQALALAELGYADLALYILKNLPDLDEGLRQQIGAFYQRPSAQVSSYDLVEDLIWRRLRGQRKRVKSVPLRVTGQSS